MHQGSWTCSLDSGFFGSETCSGAGDVASESVGMASDDGVLKDDEGLSGAAVCLLLTVGVLVSSPSR